MKKYFKFFYLALFAVLAISVTSCSKDDDEPNGGGDSNSSFTVNGQNYSVHKSGASNSITDYSEARPDLGISIIAELYPSKSGEFDFFPHINMSLDAKAVKLSKGLTLDIENGYVEYLTDFGKGAKFSDVISGNVTVEEVLSSSVTLKFNNLKLQEEYRNDNRLDIDNVLTLNGTLVFKYTKI